MNKMASEQKVDGKFKYQAIPYTYLSVVFKVYSLFYSLVVKLACFCVNKGIHLHILSTILPPYLLM